MEYPNYKGVKYKLDESGSAEEVMCPLIDDWIYPEDCMENRSSNKHEFLEEFKKKKDFYEICQKCPFQNY